MSNVYTRFRNRGFIEKIGDMRYAIFDPSGLVYTSHTPRYYTEESSAIADVVNVRAYNQVNHTKFTWNNPYITAVHLTNGNSVTFSPCWYPVSCTRNGWQPSLLPLDGVAIGSSLFQDFCNAAFYKFCDVADSKLDVYNVAKDFLTVKGLVGQVAAAGGKLIALYRKACQLAGRRARNLPLREVAHQIGDNYLLNLFGIQPLIGEISSTAGKAQLALERIAFLRRTQGQTFPAHYSKTFKVSKPDVHSFDDGTWGPSPEVWLRRIEETVTYVASCRVRNSLTGLNEIGANIESFLAGIGVGHAAEFAWDLVPFSFVVDWFFQVDKFIERHLSINPFGGEFTVENAGVSCKSDIVGEYSIEHPLIVGGSMSGGKIHMNGYTRTPGLPADYSVFGSFPSLTPTQIAIISALVTQRAL